MSDDDLNILDFLIDEHVAPGSCAEPWKVLVVDDDRDVAATTTLVLRDVEVEGRPLNLLSAYSAAEAKEVLAEHPDIGLALIDVVMETPNAGLDLIHYIRQDMGNKLIRLVVRTGQPGHAPEQSVIIDYDISDYKEKTELSAQKLFSLAYAGLRSYQQYLVMEQNRRGLMKVLQASTALFEKPGLDDFADGILEHLGDIANMNRDPKDRIGSSGVLAVADANSSSAQDFKIVAGRSGSRNAGKLTDLPLDAETKKLAGELAGRGPGIHTSRNENALMTGIVGRNGQASLLLLPELQGLSGADAQIVDIFTSQVLTAFDNLRLHDQTERAQREIVLRLGEAVETRSGETGRHVSRVALYAREIADKLGFSRSDSELLFRAAPLHDIAKIGIPDSILCKPGKLDPDEWQKMQEHTTIGYEMLRTSDMPILKLAARIALEHHEKWAGGGYPNNIKAEDISVEGRIIGLVDVFDALTSERVYKKAWPVEKAVELIQEESGRHFDPTVVDVFLKNLTTMIDIRMIYAD
ncbi:MAG: HD domain-containing phosphohydrolase [Nisaea sp.]